MSLRFVLATIALLLSPAIGLSNDAARALYDQGKYHDALELLQKNSLTTAADYYNAGNSLYKLGKIGQALAYFEKANTLAPGNHDIKYNLALTRANLAQSSGLVKDQSFWLGTLVPLARKIPEEFADILLALVTLGLALSAYQARKRGLTFMRTFSEPAQWFVVGIWMLGCAVTGTTMLAHRAALAAVVSDLATARSGPSETFTELFKLPAGTTVELTGESRDGWRQIRFSLGNVGWIVDKDLLSL